MMTTQELLREERRLSEAVIELDAVASWRGGDAECETEARAHQGTLHAIRAEIERREHLLRLLDQAGITNNAELWDALEDAGIVGVNVDPSAVRRSIT